MDVNKEEQVFMNSCVGMALSILMDAKYSRVEQEGFPKAYIYPSR